MTQRLFSSLISLVGLISLGKTLKTQRDVCSLLLSYESMSFIIKHPKINQSLGIPITPSLPATLEVRQMDMRMLLHKMQQLALIKRCHLAFLAYFFDLWFVHFLLHLAFSRRFALPIGKRSGHNAANGKSASLSLSAARFFSCFRAGILALDSSGDSSSESWVVSQERFHRHRLPWMSVRVRLLGCC